jgi:hypothetical protein
MKTLLKLDVAFFVLALLCFLRVLYYYSYRVPEYKRGDEVDFLTLVAFFGKDVFVGLCLLSVVLTVAVYLCRGFNANSGQSDPY